MSNSEYYKSVVMAEEGSTKTIVNIPAWAQALHEGTGTQKDTINTPAAAYAYVPLVYRAVRLRADALTRVPIHFTKLDGETEVSNPFPDLDFMDLLWKTEASLCLQGVNYIEKIPRNVSKKIGGLQWINPLTMNARMVKGADGVLVYEFQQGINGAKFNLDTMIYMREFSLLGDLTPNGSVLPGDSSAKVSLNDAALLRYMSRFAAYFFEGGAMPITLGSIEGLTDKDELKRVEGVFRRAVSGVKNAFRVLFVSKAIDVKTISQPLKDMVMPELNQQARHAVALAFGIPQTMLEDAANYATSQEHRLSFWSDTVRPRGDWLAEQFNRQLLKKMGIQMTFGFDELDIFQEDENQRATSLGSIVAAINTNPAVAAWAMDVLGYDLNEEQRAALELLAAKPEPEPEPETKPKEEPVTEPEETVTEPPAKAVYADDLARWERKALRVFKESKSAVCTFESEIIPAELRAAIERGLVQCTTADSVRALFNRIEPVKATQTAAPEYKAETYALAESINELAAAYLKAQAVTPPPNINVTLPQITMTANMPEQKEPSVTFSPVIQPAETKEASITFSPVFAPNIQPSDVAVQNTVNIPDQPAPQVTNEITVQPADVKMPKPKRERQKVKRNKQGFIESTDTQIEYEE